MSWTLRPETQQDIEAIRRLHLAAFANHPYSRQTEHLIVAALRETGALAISRVAEVEGEVVGHIAFSEARLGADGPGWFLLGPVAVRPDHQGQGVGRALIEAGLAELHLRGARGCVLVGDPGFYNRFGFRSVAGVTCPGVPNENVLCLPLGEALPAGEVIHHPAFEIEA
ncbi:MAG TPA: N-acetyltransferase [Leptolyngbyaceae cyanobacterium M65_K2018_010]|nr:N-acetyltransferase [Leptolyngbyaceae cyanobacterium M65_K2018_010]